MYPKDFPFTEKWFYPSEIKKYLKKSCSNAQVEYLGENLESSDSLLGRGAKFISFAMFKLFPFTSLYVMWSADKKGE